MAQTGRVEDVVVSQNILLRPGPLLFYCKEVLFSAPPPLIPPSMLHGTLEDRVRGRGQNSICGTTTHFNLGKALRWEELKLIIQQHAQAFRKISETP